MEPEQRLEALGRGICIGKEKVNMVSLQSDGRRGMKGNAMREKVRGERKGKILRMCFKGHHLTQMSFRRISEPFAFLFNVKANE